MTQPPHASFIPLAETDEGLARRVHGVFAQDLLRSMYVLGKTGTGKSVLLERVALAAAKAGAGVALLDPHGDLAARVLALLPRPRWNDVVHLVPKDPLRSVGLNLLAEPGVPRPLVAAGLVEVFRRTWGQTLFGPRSEHVLRNAVLALLEVPGATLLSLERLLVDETFRMQVLAKVTDPSPRAFFLREFALMDKRLQAEVVSPVLNKLGAFGNPAVRRTVGQAAPRLRLSEVMDEGRILVADLSGIGRDGMEVLGSLLVTGLAIAAVRRADRPPAERRPSILVADEFHAFATPSFADVLSETRKYSLGAVMAHQYLEQIESDLRAAILGNAGTLAVFQVGAEDAKVMAAELGGGVTAARLTRLEKYELAFRALRGGEPRQAVVARSLAPEKAPPVPAALLRISAERYARDAAVVDREIAQTLQGGSIPALARRPRSFGG